MNNKFIFSMSKIGKKPIKIPQEVKIELKDNKIIFSNQKGQKLEISKLPGIEIDLEDQVLSFKPITSGRQTKAFWGTMRALCNNAVIGLTSGFEKQLEIRGLGYRVRKEGQNLIFQLGYSHPVNFKIPEDIDVEVKENIIKVKGYCKARVGQVAAKIRELKKPDPYKGKGIRYLGEEVKLKPTKRATTTTAT